MTRSHLALALSLFCTTTANAASISLNAPPGGSDSDSDTETFSSPKTTVYYAFNPGNFLFTGHVIVSPAGFSPGGACWGNIGSCVVPPATPLSDKLFNPQGYSRIDVTGTIVAGGLQSSSGSVMASGGGTPEEPEYYYERGQESEPAAGAYLANFEIDVPVVEEHGLTDFVWANAATNTPSPSSRPFRAAYFFNSTEIPFTHFTIPEALPGGDSEFQLIFNGSESHTLQAGSVFDFTAHAPQGVSTFLLTGFDASEGLLSDDPFSHTHGYRFAQEGATFVQHRAVTPGDFNLDGGVGRHDYHLWKSSFGETGDHPADGNGDGVVDAADYTLWVDNYNEPAIAEVGSGALAQAPEPTSGLILMVGLTVISTLRRKSWEKR